jgi:hypothetical protein
MSGALFTNMLLGYARSAPSEVPSRWIIVRRLRTQEELERSGAARVYEDPADLLRHLDEIGSRR